MTADIAPAHSCQIRGSKKQLCVLRKEVHYRAIATTNHVRDTTSLCYCALDLLSRVFYGSPLFHRSPTPTVQNGVTALRTLALENCGRLPTFGTPNMFSALQTSFYALSRPPQSRYVCRLSAAFLTPPNRTLRYGRYVRGRSRMGRVL